MPRIAGVNHLDAIRVLQKAGFAIFRQDGGQGALDVTKEKVFNEAGFEKQWKDLLPTDQLLLGLIAQDTPDLQGNETRKSVGARLGLEKPVTAGALQNSLRRLIDKNIITRMDRGTYRIEDEAFADWLRHQD